MFQHRQVITALNGLGVLLAATLMTVFTAAPAMLLHVYAQENSRAIGAVRVESNQAGVLEVSWDAPTATPREYRVMWARVDESFSLLSRQRRQCLSDRAYLHNHRLGSKACATR